MENTEYSKKEESGWKVALVWSIAILVCLAIWVGGAWLTHCYAYHHFPVGDGNSAPALFGDSFGAVNALISAFAFAGMIVTFWLQRKELKLQRDELESQRMEFTQQNKTLKLQRFENTFFNMMQLQQQIIGELRLFIHDRDKVYKSGPDGSATEDVVINETLQGRQVIEYLYKHEVNSPRGRYYDGLAYALRDKGTEAFKYSLARTQLDHYFGHLLAILQFVDSSHTFDYDDNEIRNETWEFVQKYHYVSMLRATMSRYELVLLFYNGLSIYGQEKLKPLIEKYAIFHNLNPLLLTLSKENILRLNKHDASEAKKFLADHGLYACDYSFMITDKHDNPLKYYVTAFGVKDDDVEYQKQYIEKVNQVLAEENLAEE